MKIDVSSNPNCGESGEILFNVAGTPRPVRAIVASPRGTDELCDVTGVSEGGRWTPAYAVEVNDSGDGTAWLIAGGSWGLRLRPAAFAHEPWDLSNPRQWGETHKLYGNETDILFE